MAQLITDEIVRDSVNSAAELSGFLAVFDVDETLIRAKSMFAFLRYLLVAEKGSVEGIAEYVRQLEHIQELRRTASRETVNREFYRLFKNKNIAVLRETARAWFEHETSDDERFFIPETCALLARCRRQGAVIVFLSGSADFILDPIVRHLGGGHVLAIQLQVVCGIATGELEGIQTIGSGKRVALEQFVRDRGLSFANSIAVGDHTSDLPFLEIADRPHVVSGDDELARFAREKNWQIIDIAHALQTE